MGIAQQGKLPGVKVEMKNPKSAGKMGFVCPGKVMVGIPEVKVGLKNPKPAGKMGFVSPGKVVVGIPQQGKLLQHPEMKIVLKNLQEKWDLSVLGRLWWELHSRESSQE